MRAPIVPLALFHLVEDVRALIRSSTLGQATIVPGWCSGSVMRVIHESKRLKGPLKAGSIDPTSSCRSVVKHLGARDA